MVFDFNHPKSLFSSIVHLSLLHHNTTQSALGNNMPNTGLLPISTLPIHPHGLDFLPHTHKSALNSKRMITFLPHLAHSTNETKLKSSNINYPRHIVVNPTVSVSPSIFCMKRKGAFQIQIGSRILAVHHLPSERRLHQI